MSANPAVDSPTIERGRPWLACTGPQFRMLLQAGVAWLGINHQSINDLNVFPVPDGDSGTNMLLTLQAAYDEIAQSPNHSAGEALQAAAKGALMGARGNSGVILSQFLRGMANAIDGRETFAATDLARAFREGARLAYQGVQKPVEGTILTVARELSDAATTAAADSDDLRQVFTRATAEAGHSVARTPQLLPTLAKAGVVDAGGQGLYVILQGALKFINGERVEYEPGAAGRKADVTQLQAEEGWGFDIQCIIRGKHLDVAAIRAKIEAMGESVLVVGDAGTIKVHAHAPTPGPILDYCVSAGIVSKVIVENMEEQYQEILLTQQRKPPIAAESISGIGTISVVSGSGLQQVFESLGASRIVSGGATMNPSVQDILSAVEDIDAEKIVVLPNDKNIILAAQQACRLTSKSVRIIPTTSVPQGIAALLAFNFQADLDANAEAMSAAIKRVATGEITRAVRTVSLDGLDILDGQIIGLVNGALNVAGNDHNVVALDIIRKMNAAHSEIVTIYYGQDVTQADADRLAADMRAAYPHLQVDVVSGGQPHIHYILSAE
ncbi:MAG: DAK2 domain-containing protein [Chloroflexi bacterium]|nr:DAK2 domain-containing protein [Chloroflexota bacterium]